MNIFEEQLRNRIQDDDQAVAENLRKLGDAVNGKNSKYYAEDTADRENIRQIKIICRYFGLPYPDDPPSAHNMTEQIENYLRPSGATKRLVELSNGWWDDGDGPLLAQLKGTRDVIALLPGTFSGYYYTDRETGEKVRVTKKNKDLFEKDAYCFYKPLPNRPLSGMDYIKFLLRQISTGDMIIFGAALLFITIFGMVTPYATQYAFQTVIPSGKQDLLFPLAILLMTVALSSWLMNIVRSSILSRMETRLDVVTENAVYSRLIRLPVTFFSKKSSGGLARKVGSLCSLSQGLVNVLFGTFLTVLVSLIYIVQVLTIAESLAVPVLIIYLCELALFIVFMIQEHKYQTGILLNDEKNSGLTYALISGIQKIRLSGSENRAFAKWLETYTQKIRSSYAIHIPATIQTPLIAGVHMLGTLIIYIIAYNSQISTAQFAAFSAAFGIVMGGITSLSAAGPSIARISPTLKRGEEILQTVPEQSEGKHLISSLRGKIDLEQVTFQYDPDTPPVINGISLHIKPGEYVAIVGKSGCGKSTLLRILLGFEKPQQGAVYYDSMDMDTIDKQSLRRHIGTVLQEGKLFTGDIYSNIIISAPWMSMDDAWKAAEKAGMADHIRSMPMGMHTLISEGGGGISGGQKQRILIARALCQKPGILMLDEATSALDNITQKIVTDSLDQMDCTRIVIAHRLSTIRSCDRIIVLDKGVIAEDGTYDELIAQSGLFAELVKRQMAEEA